MRPTRRGWAVAAVALLLYFFANQTQVGWLYVLSALVAGVWLTAWFLPRLMLRGLALARRINNSAAPAELELYAGETITVELELTTTGRAPALQVRGEEICPLAPVGERTQSFFVPGLPPRAKLTLNYETTCARRGWFEFPAVALSTRAPFGFFSARREVLAPTGVLVFPEYRDLERLALFDRTPAAQNTFTRLGAGGEFVGVREYRPGDSPRHVHWRSTARIGQLIVKEFASETEPGLTIALDLRAASVAGSGEATSLELAIKVAATLARYAHQRELPVSLAVNSRAWPVPPGPLSWWGLMNALARVQAAGEESFADCLRGLRATSFVAAILPSPDEGAIAPLVELKRLGLGVLAVVIDPNPFLPDGWGKSGKANAVAGVLKMNDVSVCVIDDEPDWERTLGAEETQAVHRGARRER
jgi:uncharacterized protein (DUF58 family)